MTDFCVHFLGDKAVKVAHKNEVPLGGCCKIHISVADKEKLKGVPIDRWILKDDKIELQNAVVYHCSNTNINWSQVALYAATMGLGFLAGWCL